jgi:hypothetical protein
MGLRKRSVELKYVPDVLFVCLTRNIKESIAVRLELRSTLSSTMNELRTLTAYTRALTAPIPPYCPKTNQCKSMALLSGSIPSLVRRPHSGLRTQGVQFWQAVHPKSSINWDK